MPYRKLSDGVIWPSRSQRGCSTQQRQRSSARDQVPAFREPCAGDHAQP
jgi:hypothetical protein